MHVNALMQKCRTRPRCSIHSKAQFVPAPLHRRHLDKKHVMEAMQEHEIYTNVLYIRLETISLSTLLSKSQETCVVRNCGKWVVGTRL